MTDFSFLFIQGTDYKRILEKNNVSVYAIILNRTNVFNINDKKCFLSTKLAYGIKMISEGTCHSEVMMLKIQLYRHRNKLHFKMYYNKNNIFFKY